MMVYATGATWTGTWTEGNKNTGVEYRTNGDMIRGTWDSEGKANGIYEYYVAAEGLWKSAYLLDNTFLYFVGE